MSTIAEAEKAVEFNVFYAKRNVVDSIWKEAIIEGVNITYPQAKVIVEYNQTVEGLTVTGTIKELYLKNREIGEKVYNAVLSGRLDLACFCGDSSKYYSVLTRSTRQDGALQVTEIDRKGPIGHRLLTGPKQLELPGCGATIAAVSDVSRCTEQEILDAVGFKMQQGLNSKAVKCKAGHQRLDAERTKTDLPKERKSPAR